MSMTYSQLTANIQDICETTFTSDQLRYVCATDRTAALQHCSASVVKKNVSGTVTNGNKYLAVPSDYLYTYSLAVLTVMGLLIFA